MLLHDGDQLQHILNISDEEWATFNKSVRNIQLSPSMTNFYKMFLHASSFNQPLLSWNISPTNVSGMFAYAYKFNQDISHWNLRNVTACNSMFLEAIEFNRPLHTWNAPMCTNFTNMFTGALAFNGTLNALLKYNFAVNNMSGMFSETNAFNQDISEWSVGTCVDFSDMFMNARAFNQDISNWKVSNTAIVTGLFFNASSFNQNLTNWHFPDKYLSTYPSREISYHTYLQSIFEGSYMYSLYITTPTDATGYYYQLVHQPDSNGVIHVDEEDQIYVDEDQIDTLLELPTEFKVSKAIEKRLAEFANKMKYSNILQWKGNNLIHDIFYLYLLKKYKSNCLILRKSKKSTTGLYGDHDRYSMGITINITGPDAHIINVNESCNQLITCITNKVSVIIIPFNIIMVNIDGTLAGHANVLIYRHALHQLEHFEPHGAMFRSGADGHHDMIQNELAKFVEVLNRKLSAYSLHNITFIPPHDMCPAYLVGLQDMESFIPYLLLKNGQSEAEGYCLAWSMFFTEIVLKNPTISSRQLYNVIYSKFEQTESANCTYFKNVIRGYVHFIYSKIEDWMSIIFDQHLLSEEYLHMYAISSNRKIIIRKLNEILKIEYQAINNPEFNIQESIDTIREQLDRPHAMAKTIPLLRKMTSLKRVQLLDKLESDGPPALFTRNSRKRSRNVDEYTGGKQRKRKPTRRKKNKSKKKASRRHRIT